MKAFGKIDILVNNAKNLLKLGCEINIISQETGLNKEELEKFKLSS